MENVPWCNFIHCEFFCVVLSIGIRKCKQWSSRSMSQSRYKAKKEHLRIILFGLLEKRSLSLRFQVIWESIQLIFPSKLKIGLLVSCIILMQRSLLKPFLLLIKEKHRVYRCSRIGIQETAQTLRKTLILLV